MVELNKIYCENCLDTMKRMSDNFVDLTVTSPPYDNLREYKGYSFPFEEIAMELFRVTKQGGVVVWVVGDATVNGTESGSSFRQALSFMKAGFNLHDTMIYQKKNFSSPERVRYHSVFEYMFVFSNGSPETFNPIKDRKNITEGQLGNLGVNTFANKDGTRSVREKNYTVEYGMRHNVWLGNTRGQEEMCEVLQHPAMMPKWIAEDHIVSWSNENELVYDPFGGSGTTGEMALKQNRKFILSEISEDYVAIAQKRIDPYLNQMRMF